MMSTCSGLRSVSEACRGLAVSKVNKHVAELRSKRAESTSLPAHYSSRHVRVVASTVLYIRHAELAPTDTRPLAVRPRVTSLAPCLPSPRCTPPSRELSNPSTSPDATSPASEHFRLRRILHPVSAYRLREDCTAETATNYCASKTSSRLAICTVPRLKQPLRADLQGYQTRSTPCESARSISSNLQTRAAVPSRRPFHYR
jgi:hypothetical protein